MHCAINGDEFDIICAFMIVCTVRSEIRYCMSLIMYLMIVSKESPLIH